MSKIPRPNVKTVLCSITVPMQTQPNYDNFSEKANLCFNAPRCVCVCVCV